MPVDTELVTARLETKVIERLDRLGDAMSKRAGGAVIKRGTVARMAIERGLVALETELGLTKKPKR